MEERIRACLAVALTVGMSELGVMSLALDPSGAKIRSVARLWGRQMVRRLGMRVHVTGQDRIDWHRPLVLMANHNSHLDIPILYGSLPVAFGMLAKADLFRFPVFGTAMRGMGCIPIERDRATRARTAILDAARLVRSGQGIVVFPEGTRGDGTSIRPFKLAPFRIALEASVPILPVAITGTAHICPRDQFRVRPGDVRVIVGTPIEPPTSGNTSGMKARAALARAVRDQLHTLSGLPLSEQVPDPKSSSVPG